MPSPFVSGSVGAAEGIGRAGRTFGAALEHIMGQLRMEQEAAYQRQRDAVSDRFREREIHATEEGNRIERVGTLYRAYESAEGVRGGIEEAGYTPVEAPAPGAYSQMFQDAFGAPAPTTYRRGEYDASRDRERTTRLAEIQEQGNQARLTTAARARAESGPPTFNYAGAEFPRTPEGYADAGRHGTSFEELPGRGGRGDDLEPRRTALVDGALRRMTGPDGSIDYTRLEDVLDDLRRRPRTTTDDIDYLRKYFKQEF